jgi:hypothetical protein
MLPGLRLAAAQQEKDRELYASRRDIARASLAKTVPHGARTSVAATLD